MPLQSLENFAPRHALLPLVLALSTAGPAWSQSAAPQASTLAEVTVIGSSPVADTGIPIGKFAGNVQTLSHDALETPTTDLTERLSQSLGSVHVNDTQGNPFSVDLNYRGFTASPALGTPQGLSVYLDGMRINEAFGDVVSWDLLPQLAIDKVTVIPGSNPVYGLNTLGGAISLTSKNGNSFTGSQGGISVGSFGRTSVDVEHGSHDDDGNLYFAASIYNDRGWAANNPSQVRQVFGKYTLYGELGDIALSLLAGDNRLYGNQSVPLSMLDNAAQGYSHPDYAASQNLTLNLQGNWAADASNSYAGNLYLRSLTRDILNSNVNALVSASTNDASCVASADCPGANLLAHYTQSILGANAQWTNTDPAWNLNQVSTLGLNTEFSHTGFTNQGQYATVDDSHGMVGVGDYLPQASVQSDNQRWGLFATSTFDATDRLSITASARFDYAALKLSGQSCVAGDLCDSTASLAGGQLTDVSGAHSYQRLNPSLGLSYLLASNWIVFANYAEGFRTPSAIELACADPAVPCSGVPNAFGADPELQAVVSRTYELGMRGNFSDRLKWRTAYYRTALENDILFNQSSLNSGYFSNVGQTLRQGLELGLDGRLGALDYAVDLDWIEATYQSGFLVANQSNSSYNTVAVKPGDFIPGIPQWVFKGRMGYALDGKTRVGLALQAQGPTYARGDDNNADVNGQVPGFATVKVDVGHSVNKTVHVFAGISNLLDAKYAGYGALATNNITTGANEQFRSLGAPRTLYAGIQAKF
jgi:outer membrane receptor protein involved in Fe transport